MSADCEKGVREVLIEIYVPLGWGKGREKMRFSVIFVINFI